MSSGISDVEIEKNIEKSRDDLKQNFAGVFTSNDLDRFVRFYSLMKKKKKNAKIPFHNCKH